MKGPRYNLRTDDFYAALKVFMEGAVLDDQEGKLGFGTFQCDSLDGRITVRLTLHSEETAERKRKALERRRKATAKMERDNQQMRELEKELHALERTDPKVRKARENYDKTVGQILASSKKSP